MATVSIPITHIDAEQSAWSTLTFHQLLPGLLHLLKSFGGFICHRNVLKKSACVSSTECKRHLGVVTTLPFLSMLITRRYDAFKTSWKCPNSEVVANE